MNKYLVVGLAVTAVLVGTVLGAKVFAPQLGDDFAGGITPSQLLTCSVSTNSCTPNLTNFYVNGGVSAGGVAANNQLTLIYKAD